MWWVNYPSISRVRILFGKLAFTELTLNHLACFPPHPPIPTWLGCMQRSFPLCLRLWHSGSGGSFMCSVHFGFGIIKCIIVFYLSMLRRYKNHTKWRENTFSHHKRCAIKHYLKKHFYRNIFTLGLTSYLFRLWTHTGGCGGGRKCTKPVEDLCSNPGLATYGFCDLGPLA